jgi:protein involved in polysaccharide export with SLBB domain
MKAVKNCLFKRSPIASKAAATQIRLVTLLAFTLCHLGLPLLIGAQEASRRGSPEIRKAIPVSPRVTNSESVTTEERASGKGDSAQSSSRRTGDAGGPSQTGSEESTLGPSSMPNTMRALNDKRRIGIRDKLSFTIVEDELPARTLTVTDSGEVDIPHIGRVEVGNRTCKQLALHIKKLLEKEFFYQATVLIGLDAAGGQALSRGRYYVHGQVNRPGPQEIPVDEVLTITKAIIRAGGFTQYANEKKVRIVRRNAPRPLEIDMVPMMKKGDTRNDIEILPEDKIFVDEKFFNFF